MTDKTDLSSIIMNDNDKKDTEDWFYNQFRNAFNDRINSSDTKNKNSDRDNANLNKVKKGSQI